MRTTTRRVISSVLAVMLLSTAGLSQVMGPPRVARSVATAEPGSEEQEFGAAAARREGIELSVREDVREACAEFALPPEPYTIELPAGEPDQQALEGLADCVGRGPLAGHDLDLIGPTELPGRIDHATESAAPADAVRALLGRLGVPFTQMITRDVPLDPLTSQHAAPRVVLAPAAEQ